MSANVIDAALPKAKPNNTTDGLMETLNPLHVAGLRRATSLYKFWKTRLDSLSERTET
jgi:hypothetical protein